MKKFWILLLGSLSLWACTKKVAPAKTAAPSATNADIKPAEAARINMGLIDKGKKTFELRCGRCHGLKQPVDFAQQVWIGILERMAPKAQLDENQKAAVLAYVQYYAKDAPKDRSNM